MILALGFFILGVVSDALITLHYIAITRGRALLAATLTVLIGGLGYFVIRRIVVTWRPDLIGTELLGCAVGTFFIVKLTKRRM
jgi:hypothetical protein